MKRLASLILAVMLLLPQAASAADLLVAQAANFMPAMKEIIPAFEKQTGLTVQATYASTGKLYGQIVNGAPFDLFLAADQRRPAKLFKDGLAAEPFVYAKGQVVLWTMKKELCAKPWTEILKDDSVRKVAIANTETAPYGTSAMKALQTEGLWDSLQSRLVYGQSIAQVFQFASTGAADAGLCAFSSVFTDQGRKGAYVVVDKAPEVIQAACVLKNAPHAEAVAKFVDFLNTDEVKAIKSKYGYK
ncbi:molybdate ABC transporter substrate-binding protein [Pseudodesulfovibrio tunisiensis]|uniref:molybdate ABC transporter substrate-binding protein n=1 Tax=Pseudodesulfovibrio tunisiensis TaxID=463192 RepID=UPI001FB2E680|nr:molybdate ABC transporter substrate-binding protein [Pseudodesulfovibrio tunisiensis]